MNVRKIVTARASGKKLFKERPVKTRKYYDDIPPVTETGAHPGDIEGGQIIVHPEVKYQTIQGFGGAFTESAAAAWLAMDESVRGQLIKAYFSEEGIGYNYGRMHIGSCDFSLKPYSYIKDGDETLESFSIERENDTVYALVRAALQENGDITLFASPWSPPLFMKDSGKYQGGKLKKQYYKLWADYIARYIEEYAKKGVRISAVTVQNEPRHVQLWESCVYTKEEELAFAEQYLKKALKPLGVKIYVYDHCRERLFERALYAFTHSDVADGIACHWYSGDYFDQVRMTREKFPGKDIVVSEACVGFACVPPTEDDLWQAAYRYGHDIMGDISNGVTAFCDWNLTLNEKGGPCHFRDNRPAVCDAPIICDSQSGGLLLRPSYYVIGQFSKFIKRGAVVAGCSKAWSDVDVLAARNPGGEYVVVAINNGGEKNGIVHIGEDVADITLERNSCTTFVIK